MIRTVTVTRYVTPLREGGSLPAIVEADDGFLYVLKFRGAGQGPKALIAELIGGEIARLLGFHVPELVFAELDASFGRIEGDEEIQDLLKASTGRNLALHYLSGAITFDPVVISIDNALASKIVWLDSLLMNVDRTPRNTNMLWWKRELWLIDHGAALYIHHNWDSSMPEGSVWSAENQKAFPLISRHVLLPKATKLAETDQQFKSILTADLITAIVNMIPDEWLINEPAFESPGANKKAYSDFLIARLNHSDKFVKEAQHAAGLI